MRRVPLALSLAAMGLLLVAAPVSAASPTITIGPAFGVNEIDHQHVFTITVTSVPGATTVFNSIVPTVSPPPSAQSTTCGNPTINGHVATCTVTVLSVTAGTLSASASATLTIDGVQTTITTDAQNGDSGPATKNYVDAAVAVSPGAATNTVGAAHVFTVTVTAFPAGATPVSFDSITPSVGPPPGAESTTCGSPTVNGNVATCTVTINNPTAGTFTANVSAAVTPVRRRRTTSSRPPHRARAHRRLSRIPRRPSRRPDRPDPALSQSCS